MPILLVVLIIILVAMVASIGGFMAGRILGLEQQERKVAEMEQEFQLQVKNAQQYGRGVR